MSFAYEAPFGGTAVPGADPKGYALAEDEGSATWFVGGLIIFKAKAADTNGQLSFFQSGLPKITGTRRLEDGHWRRSAGCGSA